MSFFMVISTQRNRRETQRIFSDTSEKHQRNPRETPEKPREPAERNTRKYTREERERGFHLHPTSPRPVLVTCFQPAKRHRIAFKAEHAHEPGNVVNSLRTHVRKSGEVGFLVVAAVPPTGKAPALSYNPTEIPTWRYRG
jgi:hypothetical protein